MQHKSGFITIIGRPNAGKSTFINNVLGQKIAIMSDKAQTTRNNIQGIYTDEDSQMVFIDTPGIHKPHHELGRRLVDMAYQAMQGVDIILFMVDAKEGLGGGDLRIIENLKNYKIPVLLVLNKIDLLKGKMAIDRVILDYMKLYPFEGIFPISAKEKTHIDHLLEEIKRLLPEGPCFYPDDMITDHPERFLVSELIREKVLNLTREEIPHSIAVVIDSMKDDPEEENLVNIYATIVCERPSQKGIIIGAQGQLLKKIRLLSKKEIAKLLGKNVNLELWVRVKKDWRNRQVDLKNFGYDEEY